MSFTAEGIFPVVIKEVIPIAEPKFATGEYDFDVAIKVQHRDDKAQEDWWNGEMSDNYCQGNLSEFTQKQMTEKTLRKLGWDGDDLMTLESLLVGKETTAKIAESKGFFNVQRLAIGGQAQAVAADKAAKILAMMGKGGAAKAAVAGGAKTKVAPAKAKSDPFGRSEIDESDNLPMGDSDSVPF